MISTHLLKVTTLGGFRNSMRIWSEAGCGLKDQEDAGHPSRGAASAREKFFRA